MKFRLQTVTAALLVTFAGAGFGQEPVQKPGDGTATVETGEARPPAKPDAEQDKPVAAKKDQAEPKSEAKAVKKPPAVGEVGDKGRTKEVIAKPPRPLINEIEQEYAACRLALAHLGTIYEQRPAITEADDAECGIRKPLHVTEILPGLTLQGGAVMRCDTARALGLWAQEFLVPASANLPGAPRLTGMQLGTTYDCRARNGTGKEQPKLSEHALGNAIDIAAFEFDNGQTLMIEPRKDTGDLMEAFQRTARASSCLYFTTVLGPGSNAAHDDHLHLDVRARKNGWRLCQ